MTEILHIGYGAAICGARQKDVSRNFSRQDLGAKRYRQFGVRERYKREAPYRICKRCIAIIALRERP